MKKISFVIFAVIISFSHEQISVQVQDLAQVPPEFAEPVQQSCSLLASVFGRGFEIDNACFKLKCTFGQLSFVGINPLCKNCTFIDDPHIVTFDGTVYDFHGRCNYSISQPFSCDRPKNESYAPTYGIYGDFQNCLRHVFNPPTTCLRYTTYKINPHTVLLITHDEVLNEVDIKINDIKIIVPTFPFAPPVLGTPLFHPVILWKEGKCVRIVAVDFSIYACGVEIFIYTHDSHLDQLFGLCGKYTDAEWDDFTSRDCTIEQINIFGKSWATAQQNPEDGQNCPDNVEIFYCNGERYRQHCTEKVETVRCKVNCGRPSSFHIENAIENCMNDCCAQPIFCDFWVKVAVESTCDLGRENALLLFGVELPPLCIVEEVLTLSGP